MTRWYTRILRTNNFNFPFSRILVFKGVRVKKCTNVTVFWIIGPALDVYERIVVSHRSVIVIKGKKGLAIRL